MKAVLKYFNSERGASSIERSGREKRWIFNGIGIADL
jgi:hypothetical protein